MPRTKFHYLALFVTIAGPLMGGAPLRAQGDCSVMEKALKGASAKTHVTPTHIYITSKVGGQTFTSEMIYAAGSMYMKINGKWSLGGSIKDIEQVEQQNTQHNSKDTCSSVKDDTINGEIASLYGSHSETAKGNIDLQVWISKAHGLPLREETNSDGGKAVISTRYEYGDVKPPL